MATNVSAVPSTPEGAHNSGVVGGVVARQIGQVRERCIYSIVFIGTVGFNQICFGFVLRDASYRGCLLNFYIFRFERAGFLRHKRLANF